MKTKKLTTLSLATAIALGAVSGVAVSLNVGVEQAHAEIQNIRAKADRQIYSKDGKATSKKIKYKQWYTVDTKAKVIKTKKRNLQPVRYMDKTVYISVSSYLNDWVQKG